MKKISLFIFGIGLIIASWFAWEKLSPQSNKSTKKTIPTTQVSRRNIVQTINYNGIVYPVIKTDIKSEIGGRIKSILIQEGDFVHAGDILFQLDSKTLEQALSEAEKKLESSQSQLDKRQRLYDRLLELSKQNFGRQNELEDAATDVQLANHEVENNLLSVAKALEELNKATIRAPYDGVVYNRQVNVEEIVARGSSGTGGTTLITLAQLDTFALEFYINEIDIRKVKLAQEVSVELDAIPEKLFKGHITYIAPNAEEKSKTRAFLAKVALDVEHEMLYPGISAEVELTLASTEQALAVLISAIFTDHDDAFVFREENPGQFERVPVKVGIHDLQYIEIQSGLEENDTVALVRP